MASSYFRGFNKLFKFGKSRGEDTGRSINTIVGVKPNVPKTATQKAKSKLKIATQKTKGSQAKLDQAIFNLQEQNRAFKKAREKKANGGRIGRRFGGDTMKKKSNVDKIRETFAPKNKNLKPVDKKKNPGLSKLPTKVRNNMGYMKSGGRAGFKGGGADMTNVASDKTKKEAKKFEKRAKDASKDVKNIGRSFTSIMNEKYRP